jgi:hypothetical protein
MGQRSPISGCDKAACVRKETSHGVGFAKRPVPAGLGGWGAGFPLF